MRKFGGIVLLALISGWIAGLLRLPIVEGKQYFMLGILTGMIILIWCWVLINAMTKYENKNHPSYAKYLLLALPLIAAAIFTFYTLHNLNKRLQSSKEEVRSLVTTIQNTNTNAHLLRIDSIVQSLALKYKTDTAVSLPDHEVRRLAELSSNFEPTYLTRSDTIHETKWSKERGQLLLSLMSVPLDSTTLRQIKKEVTFAHAYLYEADLQGLDLSGINLSDSNMSNANLSGSDLSKSNLKKTSFKGAKMHGVKLIGASLQRADLSWAIMDSAVCDQARMDGIYMQNTHAPNASFINCSIHWAILEGSNFQSANFTQANIFGTDMKRVNCSDANFVQANLRRIKWNGSRLNNADLSFATVEEKNWLNRLNEWKITGSKRIQEKYKLTADTTGMTNYMLINSAFEK